ncbi:MAG: aspartate dehydrogenase [Thermofilaceae archaeon]
MKGLAIIGCGAIGGIIAKAVDDGLIEAELLYLFDVDCQKAERLVASLRRQKPRVASSVIEVAEDPRIDTVVEAASQEAVTRYAEQLLKAGKELVVLSVGALLKTEIKPLLDKYWSRIHVPSGALAGFDAVKALALVGVDRIELTTRKHPSKLSDTPYVKSRGLDLNSLEKPTLIFEGTATEAVEAFPHSLNVAAALALVSNAPVHVKVIADPRAERNIHEVMVHSKASTLLIKVENVPHPDNPRTSYLAALSTISLLRDLCGR